MLPWFTEKCGNSSSRDHVFGWDAAEAVEKARSEVAGLVQASPDEIVFTSGATESINCALKSLTTVCQSGDLLTCSTEHESMLETCRTIKTDLGRNVEVFPSDQLGRIDARTASFADRKVVLVSLMLANNEIGTINYVSDFARAAHLAGAPLFSDITQAVGKIPVDVNTLGIDLAAFSAHKLYGPKGVGALYIRRDGHRLKPLIVGGRQERGVRAGTLNVPGIVGFGEACRIAKLTMEEESERVSKMRDNLESALLAELPDIWINGDCQNRLPNTTNIGFTGVSARMLIRDMHDIAVATQSACSSGSSSPSHVLKAIGLTDDEAYSCIRISLGRFTTQQEIDYTIGKIVSSVSRLRRNAE